MSCLYLGLGLCYGFGGTPAGIHSHMERIRRNTGGENVLVLLAVALFDQHLSLSSVTGWVFTAASDPWEEKKASREGDDLSDLYLVSRLLRWASEWARLYSVRVAQSEKRDVWGRRAAVARSFIACLFHFCSEGQTRRWVFSHLHCGNRPPLFKNVVKCHRKRRTRAHAAVRWWCVQWYGVNLGLCVRFTLPHPACAFSAPTL